MSVDQADTGHYRRLSTAVRGVGADLLASPTVLARGLDPHYKVRPHARVIGQALVELAELADSGEHVGPRLMIFTPPQLGKSTLATEWGSFWWLCKHPTHRVISTSYDDDLARRRGRRVREHVTKHGAEYGLHLSPYSAAQQEWDLTSGGGMRSVSMGSGISGHSADLLVIDDPHKDRADAESHRSREAIYDWWSSTGSQRLQPGSPAILIMTRWHPEDLAGRLLEQEGRAEEGGAWRVVHIPGIADPRFGPDPLGRQPGEPLPHPKIPMSDRRRLKAHWDNKKKTTLVRDWHSLIQGDPQPTEGALVSYQLLRDIRQYEGWAPAQKAAVAVDPSGGGRDVAGVIGGHLGDDGRLWITHDRSGVGPSADWSVWACQLAVDIGASIIFVESNFGGDMAALIIKTAWEKLRDDWDAAHPEQPGQAAQDRPKNPFGRLMPMIVAKTAKQGKLLRAEPVAQQMIMDKVRLGAYLPELEQEWVTWQPTDPSSPGRIDASVYLAYGLLDVPGASKVISTAGVSRQAVDGGQGGWAQARIPR